MHVYTFMSTTFVYMSTHTHTHTHTHKTTGTHCHASILLRSQHLHTWPHTHTHSGSYTLIHVYTIMNITFVYTECHERQGGLGRLKRTQIFPYIIDMNRQKVGGVNWHLKYDDLCYAFLFREYSSDYWFLIRNNFCSNQAYRLGLKIFIFKMWLLTLIFITTLSVGARGPILWGRDAYGTNHVGAWQRANLYAKGTRCTYTQRITVLGHKNYLCDMMYTGLPKASRPVRPEV